MKRIRISCSKSVSNVICCLRTAKRYAKLCFKYARAVFNAKIKALSATCSLKRLDSNKYQVTVVFPDRTVMIQFKRPRGPVNLDSETRPDMYPYLKNDRKTPVTIILPFQCDTSHCTSANDYEEKAWKSYEKNCLLINE
jgi:hypothetical protein